MQNNIHIIGVELNAQKVLLSLKFMHRDKCTTHQLRHRLLFARNDDRYRSSITSVHQHHELARPAAISSHML